MRGSGASVRSWRASSGGTAAPSGPSSSTTRSASIAFRLSDAAPPRTPKSPPREDALEHRSHFCSKVVYSFYKETGLVSDDRAAATVLPPDYTDRPDHPLASPVDFVAGVSLAPLEILWSPSAVLPKLPWKPGKRNSKPEFEA